MVLNKNCLFITKKSWYLKYFFSLWEKKIWTGGRSFGKKVFWGQVGKTAKWRFVYRIIWNYSVINIQGLIQSFFKPYKNNHFLNLIFFWKYGLLVFNPSEETDKLSGTYLNNFYLLDTEFGNSNILKNFSVGSICFSLQTKKNKKSTISRSSGTFCKILKKINDWIFLQFPSKTVGILPSTNFVTKGVNKKTVLKKLFKAGHSKLLGWISKVWGIAMNPVDHPHGGWTNGGIHPWTPTGFLTKNVKTRKKKCWSNSIIFTLRK